MSVFSSYLFAITRYCIVSLFVAISPSEYNSKLWPGYKTSALFFFSDITNNGNFNIVSNYKNFFSHIQANETGSSNAMELAGAKRCFSYLKTSGLKIETFISDRHRGIAKWIRIKEKGTTHFYDIWHIAKSVIKMVLKASKDNTYAILADWTKSIRRHLYWYCNIYKTWVWRSDCCQMEIISSSCLQ